MSIVSHGPAAGGVPVQIEDANGAIINPATGFALPAYDTIVINYTDGTKTVISTIVYKKSSITVATVTYTSGTTTDTYVQS